MIISNDPESTLAPQKENSMRRRRFQKGSLQQRKHGNRRVWVVLYYDATGKRCYYTLGWASEMTKSTAAEKCQEFLLTINGGERTARVLPPKLAEFVEQVYLPFYRGKWKESTASTSENRIQHHIIADLGWSTARIVQLGCSPAVSGEEGIVPVVIQCCRSPEMGSWFNFQYGNVRKSCFSESDCWALHSSNRRAGRGPGP